jgi:hypothetical protein
MGDGAGAREERELKRTDEPLKIAGLPLTGPKRTISSSTPSLTRSP